MCGFNTFCATIHCSCNIATIATQSMLKPHINVCKQYMYFIFTVSSVLSIYLLLLAVSEFIISCAFSYWISVNGQSKW